MISDQDLRSALSENQRLTDGLFQIRDLAKQALTMAEGLNCAEDGFAQLSTVGVLSILLERCERVINRPANVITLRPVRAALTLGSVQR